MPAIPVYARVEFHVTDDELSALTTLAYGLVQDHAHHADEVRSGKASDRDSARLNAICILYAASIRTMRQRGLLV
ncbi:hypothetical protein D3C71_1626060 [compost metagenome]